MATGTPPKVEPNEEIGKQVARSLFGSGDEIALDSDRLREIGVEWQRKANLLRDAAEEVAKVGSDAQSEAEGFQGEYQPSGAYTADYASMIATDTAYAAKLNEAAAQAERLASGAVWVADNWEDAQKEAVAKTDAIDTELGANGGTSAGDEPRVYGTEVHGEPPRVYGTEVHGDPYDAPKVGSITDVQPA